MGSTAQALMKFLPGAAMTAGGAFTGNPTLATAGASSLASAGGGMMGGGGMSPDQQIAAAFQNNPSLRGLNPGMMMGLGEGSPALPATSGGFGTIGNLAASVGAPLLGVGGAMLANRPQQQIASVPTAPRSGGGPIQLSGPQQPAPQANIVQPMSAFMAYHRLLSGQGGG